MMRNIRAIAVTGIVLLGQWSFSSAQVKRLYIANDDHTDYMWTANEAQYDSALVHMLDYYIDQVDATKNNPDDLQARFNCDGSYWLTVYKKYRSPGQFDKLVAAIRSKHISSPLNTLVSAYGAQPTEAVIRGMYSAGILERQLGLRFRMAVCMENQTLPLGLGALWAGAGAKFSWRGVCGCASKMPPAAFGARKHQLYNYTGLDGSSVIMKWYSLKGHNTFPGGYAEARGGARPADSVEGIKASIRALDTLCNQASYPYSIAGAFGYGWDGLASYASPAFIAAAGSMTNSARKIRVSNEEDFFEDVVKTYPHLPSETVSYGNEWDTYCASMNETTAKVRRATEKLRNAEALAAIVGIKHKGFYPTLSTARRLAWQGYGLYWEHDWTADGPVPRPDRARWQVKIQEQVTAYSDSLLQQSAKELGRQLRKGKYPRFYVFNSLSWTRNDIADLPYTGSAVCRVIDLATGKETAAQLVQKDGTRFLRVNAENIPSVGYKVFEIHEGDQPLAFPQAATLQNNCLANRRYSIRLSPSGVITSIVDRLQNRELVKPNSYLNNPGVKDINNGEPLVLENAGPVSVTLKARSMQPVPHTVRITLYAHIDRIDIDDRITANFSDLKTWSFSFNLDQPTTRHEELGAVLTAKMETHGGHYAAQNARYDWLTLNHFADLSERHYGVTLSNVDGSFFRLGNSSPGYLDESASQISVLAGGQTDENLGIYAQNGATDFGYRFSLTTHTRPFDAAAAMKFSLAHQNPLVAAPVTGEAGVSHEKMFSLLVTSDPGILLWSLKPSEDDDGAALIARYWNLKDSSAQPAISLSRNIGKAFNTSHIETVESALPFSGNTLHPAFAPHQIKTFKIFTGQ